MGTTWHAFDWSVVIKKCPYSLFRPILKQPASNQQARYISLTGDDLMIKLVGVRRLGLDGDEH